MDDKFENRIEALLYLLVRDHVLVGDFNKKIADVLFDAEFSYKEDDMLLPLVQNKIQRLKNG